MADAEINLVYTDEWVDKFLKDNPDVNREDLLRMTLGDLAEFMRQRGREEEALDFESEQECEAILRLMCLECYAAFKSLPCRECRLRGFYGDCDDPNCRKVFESLCTYCRLVSLS